MFHLYARDDAAWLEGLRCAKAFIAGALHRHVTTWTRHGRFGVPAELNGRELCERLPAFVESHGEFGILVTETAPRLLVLTRVGVSGIEALCYGPWPGSEIWEGMVQPHLPPGLDLPRTRWNAMPEPQ